jgi:PAS domain S-box-containing protein
MSVDALELQLAAALQRYHTLQRRAESQAKDPGTLATRTLAELGTAIEELRVAQEQIQENRRRQEELQQELAAQCAKYWELFDEMPDPYLVTRPDTTILDANRAAAELFNVSQRFLAGKTLSVFICEDRGRFLNESARLARDKETAEWEVKLRPRERAPLRVSIRVRGDGTNLRWVIRRPYSAPQFALPEPARPGM